MYPKWRGYYKAIVLYLLSSGPLSGYEIIKAIEGSFGGKIRPSPGTIYPLLRYLEEEGYINSEEQYVGKKRKKIYRITDEGRRMLESYMKDPAFNQLLSYLRRQDEEKVDILASIVEEVRFLSEIFDELDSTDRARLEELAKVLSDFSDKVSRRLSR
ncbi:transcriptional regulator, PadR-like family [Thermoproteus uzoniensis 768-20]|uniref:Transcriptional regulator, PadR-like family n=1 Tax=Thermoproteus uzoniensis (strain 768-20) TaxID=999630 RepID=F2L2A5_THEU7|nr:PadR family transcriptional regulator [Thermoproteus uzoniensis]AEA11770.1 transcriptional regulator, PadR-like family [Thermoproteus uzoniensis 768-20]